MHSIPCTGVELSMRDGSGERRALIVGDNNSRRQHRTGRGDRACSPQERLAQLRALYDWDGDLVIADAGGGMIHGVPADFAQSPAASVVCVHTAALPEEAGRHASPWPSPATATPDPRETAAHAAGARRWPTARCGVAFPERGPGLS